MSGLKIAKGVRGDNWSEGWLRNRWPDFKAWKTSSAGPGSLLAPHAETAYGAPAKYRKSRARFRKRALHTSKAKTRETSAGQGLDLIGAVFFYGVFLGLVSIVVMVAAVS